MNFLSKSVLIKIKHRIVYLVWYSDEVPYETKDAVISMPFTERGLVMFQQLKVKKFKRKADLNK